MKFEYSILLAHSAASGDEIVILRPEVPIRLHGPNGRFEFTALVDTGADSSILPRTVADTLE
jgi:hypothetical protein